ncbi:MAG: MerR family transcriptional regulator [Ruminiclostridium sp.]|nr:MerR family transcriptional regulator [Ruminiclostridium sp.]MBQ9933607.1 MerR family transcriptional regulator [Ruminiclostridium sp.]
MTIKEMETRTGLTRANIRFYEAEGLITPERRPNGYRDYSEEDLTVLQRVKLLRSLHMSLEEIKAVQAGDRTLAQALDRHLLQLEQDQADLERSKVVCRVMQGDGVCYETLDAPRYLEELERAAQGPPVRLDADQLPRVKAPWRRFFARNLDYLFYSTIWDLILIVFGVNISNRSTGGAVLDLVVCVVVMFLLEPVLLFRFGTTPGKKLWGFEVSHPDGRRLTYQEAYQRTLLVFLKGMGFCIPIYEWIRNYKCYLDCQEGKILPWEEDTVLVEKDDKAWRGLAYVGLALALAFGVEAAEETFQPPHNKGDITVEEFCQNYNELAEYHDMGSWYTLGLDGTWIEPTPPENTILVMSPKRPVLTFQEEDGVMTGMTYTIEGTWSDVVMTNYTDHITLFVRAFVCAQEEYAPVLVGYDPLETVLAIASSHDPDGMDKTLYGVRVTADTEWDSEGDYAKVAFSMKQLG